jgi:hypothetical protein
VRHRSWYAQATARWLTDERDRLARALDDQHAATDALHNERGALLDRLRAAEAALRNHLAKHNTPDLAALDAYIGGLERDAQQLTALRLERAP